MIRSEVSVTDSLGYLCMNTIHWLWTCAPWTRVENEMCDRGATIYKSLWIRELCVPDEMEHMDGKVLQVSLSDSPFDRTARL